MDSEAIVLSISELLKSLNYKELEGVYSEDYEAARLIRRYEGASTIVFKCKDTPLPIVSNLFDSKSKILKSLGVNSINELYEKLTCKPPSMEESFVYDDFEEYYEKAWFGARGFGAIKYYEKDGGRYITSSVIVACKDDVCNASVHRIKVIDDKTLVARIVPRHLYRMIEDSRSRGEELPITILLGLHPIITLSASTSPPYGFYELTLPSLLFNRRIRAVRSPIHGNPIPLAASVVVEARVTLEDAPEGPFADILLLYDKVRMQPKIRVEGVWVLSGIKPYYHAILPGGLEHMLIMGLPREASIWKSVSNVVPKVHEVTLTRGGGGWLHAVVSITKNHDGDAKNAILAAFAGHPSLKLVVIVDDDVNVNDPVMVEWAIATRFQADRDLIVICSARGSTLDPSTREGLTCKVGIDATKPLDSAGEYDKAVIPGD